jgi:hypothetical protein
MGDSQYKGEAAQQPLPSGFWRHDSATSLRPPQFASLSHEQDADAAHTAAQWSVRAARSRSSPKRTGVGTGGSRGRNDDQVAATPQHRLQRVFNIIRPPCSALLCCVGEYGGPSLRRRRLPCRTSAAEGTQRIVKQRRSLLLPRCLPIHFRCFALRCAASQFGGTDNIGSAPLAAAGPQFTRLVQACPAAVPERAPVSVPVPMSLFRGDDEG